MLIEAPLEIVRYTKANMVTNTFFIVTYLKVDFLFFENMLC
jgi:hypothetical protein